MKKKENVQKKCVTLITQVLVDAKDSAFSNQLNQLECFIVRKRLESRKKKKDYTFVEDAGRGYRRVVPSPMPIDIIEKDTVKELFQKVYTCNCCWWWRYSRL